MSNISRLTSLAAAGAGGETEQHLAIAVAGTVTDLRNSLVVIPWSKSEGFGNYSAIPASSAAPPNRPSTYTQAQFSKDGGAIVFTHFDVPLMSAYAFANGAIGAKYSNPSTGSGSSSATGVGFSNSGNFVTMGTNASSSNLHTYGWTDASGFGSRYQNNLLAGFEPRHVEWSPTDNWIGTISNRAKAVKWTGSGYGTDDSTLLNTSQFRTHWNNAGDHVLMAGSSGTATSRLMIWTWSDSSGYVSNVSPALGFATIRDAKWTHDDTAIVLTTTTYPYLKAYAWDNATSTLGAQLSGTATPPSAYGTSISFNTAGDVVFVGVNNAKLVEAYEFDSTTGFGSKYDLPDLTGFPTSGPNAAGIDYKDFG